MKTHGNINKITDDAIDKENKNGKETERRKKEYQIYKYSGNSNLYESILINNVPSFLSLTEEQEISFEEKIELEDVNLVPPNRINILAKNILFLLLKKSDSIDLEQKEKICIHYLTK
jgi:hypothetical protein